MQTNKQEVEDYQKCGATNCDWMKIEQAKFFGK